MKRRDFVKASLISSGVLGLQTFPYHLYASDTKKFAHDTVKLGNTGIEVSRLAMGTGTHGINRSSNQTRKLGVEGVGDLLQAAYDQGVYFWDSADQYGTHPHLKAGLKRVPREKVVILTKTHAQTEAEMKADLDRFRKEIGTDYLDIVLLHCMMNGNWPNARKGAMEALSRAREDGIVRAHGVSCHTLSALEAAAESDWVQVDLARINPDGVRMDADVPTIERILRKMRADGKGIIGMKIFGGGSLRNKTDQCLQYTLAQDYVDCFTIGQENQQEMNQLLQKIPDSSVRG